MSGLLADASLYRFSSKEFHPNSGLLYYLYRFYEPNLQRWVNRDPLMDYGSTAFDRMPKQITTAVYLKELRRPNAYKLVVNSPINKIDTFGLQPWMGPSAKPMPPGGIGFNNGGQQACPCKTYHYEEAGFETPSDCANSCFGDMTGIDVAVGATAVVGNAIAEGLGGTASGPLGTATEITVGVGLFLQWDIFYETCNTCLVREKGHR